MWVGCIIQVNAGLPEGVTGSLWVAQLLLFRETIQSHWLMKHLEEKTLLVSSTCRCVVISGAVLHRITIHLCRQWKLATARNLGTQRAPVLCREERGRVGGVSDVGHCDAHKSYTLPLEKTKTTSSTSHSSKMLQCMQLYSSIAAHARPVILTEVCGHPATMCVWWHYLLLYLAFVKAFMLKQEADRCTNVIQILIINSKAATTS